MDGGPPKPADDLGQFTQQHEEVERFLAAAYAPSVPVWQPDDSQLAKYLDDAAVEERQVRRSQVCALAARVHCAVHEQRIHQSFQWKRWPKEWQHQLVMTYLYDHAEDDLMYGQASGLLDCPELVVSKLTADQGEGFYDLVESLCYMETDAIKPGHFPVLPEANWERLMGIPARAGVTLSRARRAYIEDGILHRMASLFRFVDYMLAGILEHNRTYDETLSKLPKPPPYPPPPNFAHCNCCFSYSRPDKPLKLSRCGPYKNVGRQIHYCNAACQKSDWKRMHKLICGKPSSELAVSTSFPTTSTKIPLILYRRRRWITAAPRKDCFWLVEIHGQPQTLVPAGTLPVEVQRGISLKLRNAAFYAIDHFKDLDGEAGIALGVLALCAEAVMDLPGLEQQGTLEEMAAMFRLDRAGLNLKMQTAQEELDKGGVEWKYARLYLKDCRGVAQAVRTMEWGPKEVKANLFAHFAGRDAVTPWKIPSSRKFQRR